MSTLYVSDLDATLLRSDGTISEFTVSTIKSLVEKGMKFSFATARSASTAMKVTEGLCENIPIIVYTGTFIVDGKTRERIVTNFMSESETGAVVSAVKEYGLIPIVYSCVNGEEKYIFDRGCVSKNVDAFLSTREGDKRSYEVKGRGFEGTLLGDIFYFTFMEPYEELKPVYEFLRDKCNCLFQPDNYTDNYFLEVMPKEATKAKGAVKLKEMLGADRLISFGDGINDIELFKVSDEAYAVSNAEEELKKYATGIIGNCNEDAVAKWLLKNSGFSE